MRILPLILAFPGVLAAQVVARINITPAAPSVIIGQTVQLTAEPVDASGRRVSNAIIRYQRQGSVFEGGVDSTGLVSMGAPGKLIVNVTAIVEGQRPFSQRVEVVARPGPAAAIEVDPAPSKLMAGQQLTLRTRVFSANKDLRQEDKVRWSSSTPSVARIDSDGNLIAVAAGKTTITAAVDNARQSFSVAVVSSNIRSITLTPGTISARTGDVIRFTLKVTDAAGREIDGLTPSWLMAGGEGLIASDGSLVAYKPGTYTVTALFGSRSATANATIVARDVRRPATILGAVRSKYQTSEVWVHPNGKVVYLASLGGGLVYTIDVTDSSKPVIVDSILPNARIINDVMSSEDGKVLVATREGADNRKNGIAIYTLDDPLHPKFASEFSDPVTSGVHSAYINTQAKYGRFVYLTADGQGRLYIVDITDPAKPKQVATWQVPRTDAGRYLHDVDVRDGLLYASYLNDGLVILDVGNGIKGGSPSNPQLVSQFKYDLVSRRGEAVAAGTSVIGGTHTAFRRGKYVFIGDEILPYGGSPDHKGVAEPHRAWGGLQVIDVSDIFHPKSVAWYEPEYGGVHNLWIEGDTLYMGAYQAGFRAFDISGELRGDLRSQQREMVSIITASPDGKIPNSTNTWGAVVKNGLVYVPDIDAGLSIIRIEPKTAVIP